MLSALSLLSLWTGRLNLQKEHFYSDTISAALGVYKFAQTYHLCVSVVRLAELGIVSSL